MRRYERSILGWTGGGGGTRRTVRCKLKYRSSEFVVHKLESLAVRRTVYMLVLTVFVTEVLFLQGVLIYIFARAVQCPMSKPFANPRIFIP